MSVHHLYARARYGDDRFIVQDLGAGARLMVALYRTEIRAWEHKDSIPIDPTTFVPNNGAELHPLLVEALRRSVGGGKRVVPIRQARGRLEAILATIKV